MGGSVVKGRSRAFQTFADIQRVLAVAEATSISVAALQTFADIARDTSAWRAGALTLRQNTLNLHRESPIRAERRNDATPTADICGHARRPVDHRLCSEADVRVKCIIFPRPEHQERRHQRLA